MPPTASWEARKSPGGPPARLGSVPAVASTGALQFAGVLGSPLPEKLVTPIVWGCARFARETAPTGLPATSPRADPVMLLEPPAGVRSAPVAGPAPVAGTAVKFSPGLWDEMANDVPVARTSVGLLPM